MTPRALLAAALLLPAPAGAAARARPAASASTAAETADGSPLPVYAASTEPVTLPLIAARFAQLDGRLRSLRADFRQFVRLEGSDVAQQVEGEILLRKPDLLRLTHRLPQPQVVIADGTWLWAYRPDTNQVIKTRLADWRAREPLAKGLLDLGRSADLLQRYAAAVSSVSAPGPDGYRTFVVTLTPKPAERAAGDGFTLTLTASTRDYFPGDATLRVDRATIRSTFENVRVNPSLPERTFRFAPPPGADVFTAPAKP